MTPLPMIPSPCNRICTYDPARGLCVGCLRTLEEIGEWHGADDARRAAILRMLEARRAALDSSGIAP